MTQKRTRIDRNIDIDEHGKYHISLYYGYENGKYKRKSVTCSGTEKEARDIRDKHECDVRFYGKASTNTKITVAECIEQYIEEKPLEKTTKDGYRTRLKRISKYPLGKKSMVSVKKIDIDRYLDGLQKGTPLKNKTINGDRQLLQAIFNYAMECEYISKNVTIGVKKKQEDKYQAKTLPIEEYNLYLSKLEECNDIRLKVVLSLGGVQGLRRGEMCGLKWGDIIETQQGTKLQVQRSRTGVAGGVIEKQTKTVSSNRTIPLLPITKKALEEYRSYQEKMGVLGEYIILANKGTPIHPSQIDNMFSSFLKRAELGHIRVHDLRHTCCTLFMENGAKLSTVSKFLGHSSVQVTERIYTHLHDNITDEMYSIGTGLFGA